MAPVKVIIRFGDIIKAVEVDSQDLSSDLTRANEMAKVVGLRPGQPTNLLGKGSDPISYERIATWSTVMDAFLKRNKKK